MASSAYVDWHADLLRRTGPPAFVLLIGTLACCLTLRPLLGPLSFVVATVGIGSAVPWLLDSRVGTAAHRDAIHPLHIVGGLFFLAGGAVGFVIASTILREVTGASTSMNIQAVLAATLLGLAAARCYWPATLCFLMTLAAFASHQTGGLDALTISLTLAVPGVGLASLLALVRLPADHPSGREPVGVDGHDITIAVEEVLAAVDQANTRFLARATGSSPQSVEGALDELTRHGRVERVPRRSLMTGGTAWRRTCGRSSIDAAQSAGT